MISSYTVQRQKTHDQAIFGPICLEHMGAKKKKKLPYSRLVNNY